VSCNGVGERIAFRRNRIEDMAGMAISWSCSGSGNVIEQTQIARSCRQKNPETCTPGAHRTCYYQPDVLVAPGSVGDLSLVDDEVTDSGCASPLAVDLRKPEFALRIRGGRYAAGRAAILPVSFQSVDVTLDGGASFAGTAIEFGPDTRGAVAPSVSVTGKWWHPFRVDRRSRVLVCADRRSECEQLCAGADPPPWCRDAERSQ